jgi:hypothetical protein
MICAYIYHIRLQYVTQSYPTYYDVTSNKWSLGLECMECSSIQGAADLDDLSAITMRPCMLRQPLARSTAVQSDHGPYHTDS